MTLLHSFWAFYTHVSVTINLHIVEFISNLIEYECDAIISQYHVNTLDHFVLRQFSLDVSKVFVRQCVQIQLLYGYFYFIAVSERCVGERRSPTIRAMRAQILFLSLMMWHATSRMQWKNTLRWATTRMLTVSISVRRTRGYLNIWYTTTRICWSYSNKIISTFNMFTTISWMSTCGMTNFAHCTATVGNKNMNF